MLEAFDISRSVRTRSGLRPFNLRWEDGNIVGKLPFRGIGIPRIEYWFPNGKSLSKQELDLVYADEPGEATVNEILPDEAAAEVESELVRANQLAQRLREELDTTRKTLEYADAELKALKGVVSTLERLMLVWARTTWKVDLESYDSDEYEAATKNYPSFRWLTSLFSVVVDHRYVINLQKGSCHE